MSSIAGIARFMVGALFSLFMGAVALVSFPLDYRRGRVFHGLSRFWGRTVLFICGVRLKVRGLEKFNSTRNYVYVSNHASLLDIPCVVAGIPAQIRILYKKELEVIPVFGWALKWGSYIAIERGSSASARRSLAAAAQTIRNGASVHIYAEGTRTLTGQLLPFKRGAFNLAVSAGVPIVPLTINGSFAILQKRSIVIHPNVVELVLDDPIPVNSAGGKEEEVRLMEQVHDAIARSYVNQ
jgi:1-acyl-sn-glycerol-3-phosphate acyltransferase